MSTEAGQLHFVVSPNGTTYRTLRLRTTLKAPKFNLEGASSTG